MDTAPGDFPSPCYLYHNNSQPFLLSALTFIVGGSVSSSEGRPGDASFCNLIQGTRFEQDCHHGVSSGSLGFSYWGQEHIKHNSAAAQRQELGSSEHSPGRCAGLCWGRGEGPSKGWQNEEQHTAGGDGGLQKRGEVQPARLCDRNDSPSPAGGILHSHQKSQSKIL